MKKAIFIVTILFVAVISTACINNIAVQELNNAAKSYMDKGDYNAAIERLESSLELDGTVYETYYNLGVAYVEAKKYNKAVETLSKAINLNSKYADSYADVNNNESVKLTSAEDGVANTSEKSYQNYSDEVKEKMIEGYLSAITNYRKYSDMSNSAQKTEEINSHIAEMEKVLGKLGYTGSSY